jgi:hypothetical protein
LAMHCSAVKAAIASFARIERCQIRKNNVDTEQVAHSG